MRFHSYIYTKVHTLSQSYDFGIYNYNVSVEVGKNVYISDKNNVHSKNALSY
jgi:hypothetical protein